MSEIEEGEISNDDMETFNCSSQHAQQSLNSSIPRHTDYSDSKRMSTPHHGGWATQQTQTYDPRDIYSARHEYTIREDESYKGDTWNRPLKEYSYKLYRETSDRKDVWKSNDSSSHKRKSHPKSYSRSSKSRTSRREHSHKSRSKRQRTISPKATSNHQLKVDKPLSADVLEETISAIGKRKDVLAFESCTLPGSIGEMLSKNNRFLKNVCPNILENSDEEVTLVQQEPAASVEIVSLEQSDEDEELFVLRQRALLSVTENSSKKIFDSLPNDSGFSDMKLPLKKQFIATDQTQEPTTGLSDVMLPSGLNSLRTDEKLIKYPCPPEPIDMDISDGEETPKVSNSRTLLKYRPLCTTLPPNWPYNVPPPPMTCASSNPTTTNILSTGAQTYSATSSIMQFNPSTRLPLPSLQLNPSGSYANFMSKPIMSVNEFHAPTVPESNLNQRSLIEVPIEDHAILEKKKKDLLKSATPKDADEDEDEDCLLAQLLIDQETKSKKVSQPNSQSSQIANNYIAGAQSCPENLLSLHKVAGKVPVKIQRSFQYPPVKAIIINLHSDSSEEEEYKARKLYQSNPTNSSIQDFIKSIRNSNPIQPDHTNTSSDELMPKSVEYLSKSQQKTYKQLKATLKVKHKAYKDIQKQKMLDHMKNNVKSTMSDNVTSQDESETTSCFGEVSSPGHSTMAGGSSQNSPARVSEPEENGLRSLLLQSLDTQEQESPQPNMLPQTVDLAADSQVVIPQQLSTNEAPPLTSLQSVDISKSKQAAANNMDDTPKLAKDLPNTEGIDQEKKAYLTGIIGKYKEQQSQIVVKEKDLFHRIGETEKFVQEHHQLSATISNMKKLLQECQHKYTKNKENIRIHMEDIRKNGNIIRREKSFMLRYQVLRNDVEKKVHGSDYATATQETHENESLDDRIQCLGVKVVKVLATDVNANESMTQLDAKEPAKLFHSQVKPVAVKRKRFKLDNRSATKAGALRRKSRPLPQLPAPPKKKPRPDHTPANSSESDHKDFLCPFELCGKCNNSECQFQHSTVKVIAQETINNANAVTEQEMITCEVSVQEPPNNLLPSNEPILLSPIKITDQSSENDRSPQSLTEPIGLTDLNSNTQTISPIKKEVDDLNCQSSIIRIVPNIKLEPEYLGFAVDFSDVNSFLIKDEYSDVKVDYCDSQDVPLARHLSVDLERLPEAILEKHTELGYYMCPSQDPGTRRSPRSKVPLKLSVTPRRRRH